jgi:hypothetical protein
MKPKENKPNNIPTDTQKYVESKKLEILSRLFYIITHTNWSLEYSDELNKLLSNFTDLAKELDEKKKMDDMKLKNILKK